MNRMFAWRWNLGVLLALFSLVVLAGCAAQPPAKLSVSEQAQQHNFNGVEAVLNSNPDYGRQAFALSEQLYASIENNQGRLIPLLNLSRLERRAGLFDAAARHIDLALSLSRAQLSSELAFEKALVLLQQGELFAAQNWAQKSLDTASLDQRARSLNLLGRIALNLGQYLKPKLLLMQQSRQRPLRQNAPTVTGLSGR